MTTYRYATTDDLLRAIELVPVWTASLFKRWDDATTPRTERPVRFAVVRWPSRDGSHMDRLTCIRVRGARPINVPIRFPA